MSYLVFGSAVPRYLIDAKWDQQLEKYLGGSGSNNNDDLPTNGNDPSGPDPRPAVDKSAHPGPVDNGNLYPRHCSPAEENPDQLKEHMVEGIDYALVPAEAWEMLVRTFGLTPGQVPIVRKVFEAGTFNRYLKVEIYKVKLLLTEVGNSNNAVKKYFSKSDTLGEGAP